MAEDAGKGERQVPVLHRDVGVADACSCDLHHDLIWCGILKFDVGEGERRAQLVHYRG
jgi:hypothetical protein